MHRHESIALEIKEARRGTIGFSSPDWPGLRLSGLLPSLRLDGEDLGISGCHVTPAGRRTATTLAYSFQDKVRLTLTVERLGSAGVRLSAVLANSSDGDTVLNDVTLLGARSAAAPISFGARPDAVRVMEQGNYWGRVRPLVTPKAPDAGKRDGEPNEAPKPASACSDLVWVAYDRSAGMAFLAGFLTSERWLGRVQTETSSDGVFAHWRVGFDGADVVLKPGQEVRLEDVIFLAGRDPWQLLETYADAVRDRHQPAFPEQAPVSWCSWYPYRLSVTEDRILETARIAAERLKPLGLSIIEVDLGWEKGNLPSTFEENERFPRGLKWLSGELGKLGFDLGVWKAPFTISEFDPIVRRHPEWLIRDAEGKLAPYWEWFWEPHGKVFILDLTHPGAQQWLRDNIAGLAKRGVRYLKCDFIGCAADNRAKRRHDNSIAAGGATEAARIGARIIREALPDGLLLNCGGPEQPGTGHWPLLYSCNDTGNTGFQNVEFHQGNFHTVACHLFKNRRWGIIQPSCLCVGLPGTLDEARIRATVAFLAGGQIDISDTLTTLPEDRWDVLTATLPPCEASARPIDLFDPICGNPDYDYSGVCKGESRDGTAAQELPAGTLWHVHLRADWDEWDLVGVFCFDSAGVTEKPKLKRFSIPLARLGLPAKASLWGYEFWSRQFLGVVPGARRNAGGYVHPGDFQDLVLQGGPGNLDVAFFGPAVKLLCLRKMRSHPWVVGTSFHQSCGTELTAVRWDAAARVLRGRVRRPKGETGVIFISGGGMASASAKVDDEPAGLRPGANGAWLLPVTMRSDSADWKVSFQGHRAGGKARRK